MRVSLISSYKTVTRCLFTRHFSVSVSAAMPIKVCFCFKSGKETDVASYFFDLAKVINHAMLIPKELRHNQEECTYLTCLNSKKASRGVVTLGDYPIRYRSVYQCLYLADSTFDTVCIYYRKSRGVICIRHSFNI